MSSSSVYCFSVHAEASPATLPRVVEVFALHGHVPSSCHAQVGGRAGDEQSLTVDLQLGGITAHEAALLAKRIGRVALNFPAGIQRAQTRGQAVVRVSRAAASLPANVRQILTRRRKAGDPEAAVDPLSDPGVRAAVASATFEHLIGFQMSQDMLRYNATR